MFNVTAEPVFTHTVPIEVPVDGGFRKESLKATYRVMPTDEAAKYDLDSGEGSAEFLRAVVVKLDDLIDDSKQPVPYSDALRDRLFNLPYVRRALARGYFEALAGAKRGN